MSNQTFNVHSMVAPLRRVMVCSPRAGGWDTPGQASQWRELGFHHRPDFGKAQSQHEALGLQLRRSGAEVVELPGSSDLTLDSVYAHDASLATDQGMIVLNPGKASRRPEARLHQAFYRRLGIPVLGEIKSPAIAEAGDIVWLDPRTLLVGNGYRTNSAGIQQLRQLLATRGVDVLSAPLPYGPGPCACLHLMSLISLLDEHTALVDLPWLAVETVELLKSRSYDFVEIDYTERETLACNVLALGNKSLLALEENGKTNAKLQAAGFDVRTFPGSELCINGSGGPTCLTRPLLRG